MKITKVESFEVDGRLFRTKELAEEYISNIDIEYIKDLIYFDEQTENEVIELTDLLHLFNKYGDRLKTLIMEKL